MIGLVARKNGVLFVLILNLTVSVVLWQLEIVTQSVLTIYCITYTSFISVLKPMTLHISMMNAMITVEKEGAPDCWLVQSSLCVGMVYTTLWHHENFAPKDVQIYHMWSFQVELPVFMISWIKYFSVNKTKITFTITYSFWWYVKPAVLVDQRDGTLYYITTYHITKWGR